MKADLSYFKEVETDQDFVLQNSKLLKVELSKGEIQAKLGSMVAYQGDVKFSACKDVWRSLIAKPENLLLDIWNDLY